MLPAYCGPHIEANFHILDKKLWFNGQNEPAEAGLPVLPGIW